MSVSLSNSTIDFVTQDFDMSIRLGEVSDSRLVARKLHESHFCVVASPAYLRQHGVPVRPDELQRHSCLGLLMTDSGRVMPWAFSEEDGNAREIAIHPTMTFDHPLGVVAAALSDAGFARLLDFTIRDDLMSGRLVEVLAEFRPPSQAVSAVYPSNRHVSAKVRTFLDFLIEFELKCGRCSDRTWHGRAFPSYRRGPGFDPLCVHHHQLCFVCAFTACSLCPAL